MATPKKLPRLTTEQKEDEVNGYVHFVSPVKTSTKNNSPYFQCVLQTGKGVYDEMISFSPDKHTIFNQAAEKKTPVHLTGVSKTLSFRSESGTSILCRRQTNIKSSSTCNFHHKIPTKNPLEKAAHPITLAEMANEVSGNYVNVTAKVIHLQPTRNVFTKVGHTDVQDVIIADTTGSSKLSLWADKSVLIQNGNTYHMKCLCVKEYLDERFLSTCSESTFERTDELQDVHEDVDNFEFTPIEVVGRPMIIKMNTMKMCTQCNTKMELPTDIQKKSVKCNICGMRQLVSNIKSNSNARVKLDTNPTLYEISNNLLTTFSQTHQIFDDEEMEEFFLEHEIKITLPSKTSCLVSTLELTTSD